MVWGRGLIALPLESVRPYCGTPPQLFRDKLSKFTDHMVSPVKRRMLCLMIKQSCYWKLLGLLQCT